MGSISEEDIQKVREASDLVAIIAERTPVKQRGRDFWCCCPLHNEKTPSFKIDPVLQLWHCFGCHEGGDVFGFLMQTEDLTFPEAVRKLAERAHIDIVETGGRAGVPSSKKARLKAVCEATAAFYHTQLMRSSDADAAAARSYLTERGLGGEVARRWRLGFAPSAHARLIHHLTMQDFSPEEMLEANVARKDRAGKLHDRFFNRVMFPIADVQGECIAFGGRVIGKGEPKYLNSQETPVFHKSQVLYGLDHAKAAMASTGVAVVVEGYTDVIALHEAGITNAVATLGTALTAQHIRLLSRHAQHKIAYLFDGDAAGQRAADRALGFIDNSMTPEAGRTQVELAAVTLPDNLDPAEFVEARGADALRDLIAYPKSLLQYGIDRRLAEHDLKTPEDRSRALVDALSVLAPIKDSLLAREYALQIGGRCGVRDEQEVFKQLARLVPPRRGADSDDGAQNRANTRTGKGRLSVTGPREDFAFPKNNAPRARLSQPEVNRLRFEREFLSLVAQHPELALMHANTLASTQWHEPVHETLAQSILATLAEDPTASAARVISEAARVLPRASAILTSGLRENTTEPESMAHFLAEELGIGDVEDAISSLRARLANPAALSSEEYEMFFQTVTTMQKDLTQRRLAHKMP